MSNNVEEKREATVKSGVCQIKCDDREAADETLEFVKRNIKTTSSMDREARVSQNTVLT